VVWYIYLLILTTYLCDTYPILSRFFMHQLCLPSTDTELLMLWHQQITCMKASKQTRVVMELCSFCRRPVGIHGKLSFSHLTRIDATVRILEVDRRHHLVIAKGTLVLCFLDRLGTIMPRKKERDFKEVTIVFISLSKLRCYAKISQTIIVHGQRALKPLAGNGIDS
jgi:hypothetical protein